MEFSAKPPSLKKAVRKRSMATAIRLSGFLFLFFCSLFFYQRINQTSEKIEQKISIDQEFLANALRIGDIFFIKQYLSAFVESEIVTGASIREVGGEDWIAKVPEGLQLAQTESETVKTSATGFQFFNQQVIEGTNGGLWEVHYVYQVSYSLFLYALAFSILIGLMVFIYINRMLKGVVNHFNEPVINLSKDLEKQTAKSGTSFQSTNYDLGQRFAETDRFVLELKKLVAEIKLKNEKLKEAEIHEAISRLSRQVNHDIKSPLGALKVALENLSTNPDAAQSLMTKSIDRIEKILSDLQISSNTEAKKELKLETVSMSTILKDLVAEKRAEYQGKDVKIDLLAPSDSTLKVDAIEVTRALSNIINNAVEAGHGQKVEVQIECQNGGDQYKVRIHDNGPGVPEAVRKNIFEYGVSTKGALGSGTGLSQAKQALEAHGASINLVNDESGLYRVFELTFPANRA